MSTALDTVFAASRFRGTFDSYTTEQLTRMLRRVNNALAALSYDEVTVHMDHVTAAETVTIILGRTLSARWSLADERRAEQFDADVREGVFA